MLGENVNNYSARWSSFWQDQPFVGNKGGRLGAGGLQGLNTVYMSFRWGIFKSTPQDALTSFRVGGRPIVVSFCFSCNPHNYFCCHFFHEFSLCMKQFSGRLVTTFEKGGVQKCKQRLKAWWMGFDSLISVLLLHATEARWRGDRILIYLYYIFISRLKDSH